MILETWSIALITCSLVVLTLGIVGASAALRILSHWDLGSDSELQIRLEQRIWLVATLVQFALVVQIISALVFIYSAEYFATVLKGAMCAAGSLSANPFGLPALGLKLISIFAASLWIMLHRLDISSEEFPFTRLKSFWLLGLVPLLAADGLLVALYLVNLEPEIITSCCGILFGEQQEGGYSLFNYTSETLVTLMLAATALVLLMGSAGQLRYGSWPRSAARLVPSLLLPAWIGFYLLALAVITVQVSPYVYGMPHHRCPFDLLHYPYLLIGLPLYLFLHTAVISGLGGAMAGLLCAEAERGSHMERFRHRSTLLSVTMLLLFGLTAGWRPFVYIFFGGQ